MSYHCCRPIKTYKKDKKQNPIELKKWATFETIGRIYTSRAVVSEDNVKFQAWWIIGHMNGATGEKLVKNYIKNLREGHEKCSITKMPDRAGYDFNVKQRAKCEPEFIEVKTIGLTQTFYI